MVVIDDSDDLGETFHSTLLKARLSLPTLLKDCIHRDMLLLSLCVMDDVGVEASMG